MPFVDALQVPGNLVSNAPKLVLTVEEGTPTLFNETKCTTQLKQLLLQELINVSNYHTVT